MLIIPNPEPSPAVSVLSSPTAVAHPGAVIDRRRRHRLVMAGGLGAGILADACIGSGSPAPFLLALAACVAMVSRHRHEAVPQTIRVLLSCAACFAVMTALSDGEAALAWNTVIAVALTLLAASPRTSLGLTRLQNTTIRDVIRTICNALLYMIPGPARIGEFRHEPLAVHDGAFRLAMSLARSTVLALSIVISMGVLLAAGDPVFRSTAGVLTNWSPDALLGHAFVALQFAWPATGVLMSASGISQITLRLPSTRLPVLNRLDVISTLGALALLFALFVALQIRVLFGGAAYVHAVTGLTMAEYARNGFFTLVAVSGLTVALLLAIDARFGRDSLAHWKPAQRLSFVLLGMVGLVMLSAATRMSLYVASFGLSIDRIYAFTVMLWLALVCAWFGFTVLCGRSRQFVIGALVSGGVTLVSMTLLGPDRMVMRDAIARVARGAPVDLAYAIDVMRADAVPTLVHAIAAGEIVPSAVTSGGAAGCLPIGRLLDTWGPASEIEFNVARIRARATVAAHRPLLESVACTPVANPARSP
jgi:hypothetical protein